jgi:hypothetical protein
MNMWLAVAGITLLTTREVTNGGVREVLAAGIGGRACLLPG